ncbi:PEP-CTERM sorting domain-containing protein [Desulfobacter sp.]|uniref:PEP-CTERM sorting domain-containing protein n=1 Tax=Desulfobacter sp. TaxID=2294 RepID=UPI003D0BDF63
MRTKLQSTRVFFLGLLLFFASAPAGATTLELFDAVFNLDGTKYALGDSDSLPANFTMDESAFDSLSGLGTLSINFSPGTARDYYIGGFFDHEITEQENYNVSDETGEAIGTPVAGQSWEIDEPGYSFGNIYYNLLDGTLDNQIFGGATIENDVSMAMGWNLTLGNERYTATVDFILSDTAPTSGFYLVHRDPDSEYSIYLSSELTIVPEPGTLLLMGCGLAGLALFGRRQSWTDKKNS